jgi:hypothetical protein
MKLSDLMEFALASVYDAIKKAKAANKLEAEALMKSREIERNMDPHTLKTYNALSPENKMAMVKKAMAEKVAELAVTPRLPIFTGHKQWNDAVKHAGAKAEVEREENHRQPLIIVARKDNKDVGVWIEVRDFKGGIVFKRPSEFDEWNRKGYSLRQNLEHSLSVVTMKEGAK